MKANYNKPKQQSTTEAVMGTLYDLNKAAMLKEPALTNEQVENTKDVLHDWIYERIAQKYFMLLCNERRDYTIFNLNRDNINLSLCDNLETVKHATDDVIECLMNRGQLIAADLQEDGVWECWIRIDDECFAYYLFPCDTAVLEY